MHLFCSYTRHQPTWTQKRVQRKLRHERGQTNMCDGDWGVRKCYEFTALSWSFVLLFVCFSILTTPTSSTRSLPGLAWKNMTVVSFSPYLEGKAYVISLAFRNSQTGLKITGLALRYPHVPATPEHQETPSLCLCWQLFMPSSAWEHLSGLKHHLRQDASPNCFQHNEFLPPRASPASCPQHGCST